MAYQGLAPEALVERSDSKNPATTCKGITQAGRPCRRSILSNFANGSSPLTKSRTQDNGVVAILDGGDAAAFFCHDHKDQADLLIARLEHEKRTKIVPLQHKSSIDTLAERVGVLDLDAEVEQRRPHRILHPGKHPDIQKVKKRSTLPHEWQTIQSPLMSLPHDIVQAHTQAAGRGSYIRRNDGRFGRSNVKASWSCCIRADDDDNPPPRRRNESHRPRPGPNSQTKPSSDVPLSKPIMQQPPGRVTVTRPAAAPTQSQSVSSSTHAQTKSYLSLIPPQLPPATTSALLAELSKPISSADEAGYIYIFWLTPDSQRSKPDDEVASSLLDDDDDEDDNSYGSMLGSRPKGGIGRQQRQQRTAQALQRYASVRRSPAEPQKVLLKIGRANNVHRRMSQWTKQCGQQITLVRYYPYHKDSAASLASPAGSMVPHVHKVERLVHIELNSLRSVNRGPCEQCGREHKEWFEVEATKKALKKIDTTIRRWVDWAEKVD